MSHITTNWKLLIEDYDDAQSIKYREFLASERQRNEVYPEDCAIFRCFNYFDIEDTKVVIVGQDPYHGPNQATGLCFDIGDISRCRYPPTLRNITKALGKEPDFEAWARQGVLLLNASLSVARGKPGSHLKYWQPFTKYIIDAINNRGSGVTFVVWGAFALKQVEHVDATKHRIMISSHPSPLSFSKQLRNYPAFKDSDVFDKIKEINW